MDNVKMVGKNIRAFRKLRRLTQGELGKKAKMHRAYIGFVERGEKNLSVESVCSIAKALEIPPYLLFYPEMEKWVK